MTTYDYLCRTCLHVREVTKPMSRADAPEQCHKCGTRMQRIFSAPELLFVGTGWAGKKNG